MGRSDSKRRYASTQHGRLAGISMVTAIGANALLFYVLALARTKPPLQYPEDRDIMRIISVDLAVPSEAKADTEDSAKDVVRTTSEQVPVLSVPPAVDMVPSPVPRLSDWISELSSDLPGLAVVLPRWSDLGAGQSASVYGAGKQASILQVDRAPSKIAGASPRYPQWARRAGLEAVVTLRFIVAADGTVRQIKIHDIEGDERFGAEAAKAVATWRFEPATQAGKPVACWCFQKVNFKLSD